MCIPKHNLENWMYCSNKTWKKQFSKTFTPSWAEHHELKASSDRLMRKNCYKQSVLTFINCNWACAVTTHVCNLKISRTDYLLSVGRPAKVGWCLLGANIKWSNSAGQLPLYNTSSSSLSLKFNGRTCVECQTTASFNRLERLVFERFLC